MLVDFHDRSPEERRRLTAEHLSRRETMFLRWAHMAPDEDLRAHRLERAARLLAGERSVADLGSRRQALSGLLPKARYIPVDCVGDDALPDSAPLTTEQRRNIVVVDFNRQALPAFDADAAAVLGVVEYLYDPPAFMSALAQQFRHVVVTYNVVTDPRQVAKRGGHAWVNHLTAEEFRQICRDAGFQIEDEIFLATNGREFMWDLWSNRGRAPL